MTVAKGLVVPASGGKQFVESAGRFGILKLLGHETGESIMMFEQHQKLVPSPSRQ